jgi:hypothetical protein
MQMLSDRLIQKEADMPEAKESGVCSVCGGEIYYSYYQTPDGFMLHPFCVGEWGRQQFEPAIPLGDICSVCQMPVEGYEEALINSDGDVIHYECADKWAHGRLIYVIDYFD